MAGAVEPGQAGPMARVVHLQPSTLDLRVAGDLARAEAAEAVARAAPAVLEQQGLDGGRRVLRSPVRAS